MSNRKNNTNKITICEKNDSYKTNNGNTKVCLEAMNLQLLKKPIATL